MAELSKHCIRQTVGAFERVIIVAPAWDRRSNEPGKNYGIHCVNQSFAVIRCRAAVEFQLYTGWHLPHVRREHLERRGTEFLREPLPAGVQYHAPDARADLDDKPITDACAFTGGTCFTDGSGLDALTLFDVLCTDGLDGVWRELEERWVSMFGARYA